MEIKQATLSFDTADELQAAIAKLDTAYDSDPTAYTRMGLQLVIQPYAPLTDLSPLLSLLTASTTATTSTASSTAATATTAAA